MRQARHHDAFTGRDRLAIGLRRHHYVRHAGQGARRIRIDVCLRTRNLQEDLKDVSPAIYSSPIVTVSERKFMQIAIGNQYRHLLVWALALATSYAHALGDRPPKKPELVGIAKECSDRAWKKIKATGRSYNVDRRGYDENTGLQSFWIGEHLFILPKGYLADVGFGYAGDVPGVSALLELAMPDITPQRKPEFELINGVSPHTMIFLSCNYHHSANLTVSHAAAITRESELKQKLWLPEKKMNEYHLTEFGLVGYQNEGGFDTLYFPVNSSVKNPHGGALTIRCDQRFPLNPNTTASPKCSMRFVYRDGMGVEFRFPEHYLKHWRVSYERLLTRLNSFLVEQ